MLIRSRKFPQNPEYVVPSSPDPITGTSLRPDESNALSLLYSFVSSPTRVVFSVLCLFILITFRETMHNLLTLPVKCKHSYPFVYTK